MGKGFAKKYRKTLITNIGFREPPRRFKRTPPLFSRKSTRRRTNLPRIPIARTQVDDYPTWPKVPLFLYGRG